LVAFTLCAIMLVLLMVQVKGVVIKPQMEPLL